jgi:hypothetical protein
MKKKNGSYCGFDENSYSCEYCGSPCSKEDVCYICGSFFCGACRGVTDEDLCGDCDAFVEDIEFRCVDDE